MSKCLFIHKDSIANTGGAVISERNLALCRATFGKDNVFEFPISKQEKIQTLIGLIKGNMEGLNKIITNGINKIIISEKINYVFIDTSIFGLLAKNIKKEFPEINVIVFFHNVECMYFKELIKITGKKRHYITLKAAEKNEKAAMEFADNIITLNERDSQLLKNYFGRGADFVLPTSFQDKFDENKLITNDISEIKLLFVGSLFFPNEEGVRWFIKEVMPGLDNKYKLYVVGKNFENIKNELENERIQIIGTVDNLEDWYYNSDAVISPIFSGGGMKTKIAEALMYGKPIFGTDEAFTGYDLNFEKIGGLCNNKEEFISSITKYIYPNIKFNIYSRCVFMENYNTDRMINEFLKKIN